MQQEEVDRTYRFATAGLIHRRRGETAAIHRDGQVCFSGPTCRLYCARRRHRSPSWASDGGEVSEIIDFPKSTTRKDDERNTMGTPQQNKRPRSRDIAQRLGVSETAVSFALNGRAGISDETRQRILRTVEEMGWTPNYAARALSGGGASTVGFVVARTPQDIGSESFFLQLMSGMQEGLSASNYGLLFQLVPDIEAEVAVYRKWKAENRVDGVVLVDLREGDPRPEAVAAMGMPGVVAGGPDPDGRVPSIAIDDVGAIELVLDHLVALGHTHLGYISGPAHLSHIARRISAMRRAAEERGLTVALAPTDFTAEAASRATSAWVAGIDAPTAMLFDNEVLAIAGIGAIRSAGLSIPDDVAVVSLEDSLICTATRPQITALHRETHEFGKVVVEHLLAEIGGHGTPSEQAPLPRLMVRGSTDPRRDSADPATSHVTRE